MSQTNPEIIWSRDISKMFGLLEKERERYVQQPCILVVEDENRDEAVENYMFRRWGCDRELITESECRKVMETMDFFGVINGFPYTFQEWYDGTALKDPDY